MSLKNLKSIFSTKSTLDKNNKRSIHINTGGEHFKKHTKFDDGLTKLGLTPLKPSDKLDKLGLTPLKPSDKLDKLGLTPLKPSDKLDKLGLTPLKPSDKLDIFGSANVHINASNKHFEWHTVYDDDVRPFTATYNTNQPQDAFDTKFDYNTNNLISQTWGVDVSMQIRGGRDNPLLDKLLRGRVYVPQYGSQIFVNKNLFVGPEQSPFKDLNFMTETFDPRAHAPKEGTTYFNTNNSFNLATNPTDFSTAGNDDGAFTPITELGGQFQENLSWENLYNADHTPKDNPLYKGKPAINYGPHVNRDKLNIRDNGTTPSIYNLSRRSLLTSKDSEPYIISEMPTSDSQFTGGRLLNQGSLLGVPLNRMIADTARIGKYLTSPDGIAFIAAQNFLGSNSKSVFMQSKMETDPNGNVSVVEKLMSSRQRFKQTYNPASTLLQTIGRAGFGPIGLVDKTEPGILSIFDSDEYGIDSTSVNTIGLPSSANSPFSINDTFTGGSDESNVTSFKKFGKQLVSAAVGATGIPTEAVKAFNGSDNMTLAKMIQGEQLILGGPVTVSVFTGTANQQTFGGNFGFGANQVGAVNRNELGFDAEEPAQGMPFYFKDLRDNTYIWFRAYLEGITENISPSWSSTNYMGRSEPVYTYERAERELSLTLKLAAQTSDELDMIYKKMDRLTSLCYPEYVDDEYGNRMKPPLTKFRMGEMFGKMNQELMGFIKSISYTVEQTSTWETNSGKRVPRHVTATLGYQVIHDTVPQLSKDFKFYGINYETI